VPETLTIDDGTVAVATGASRDRGRATALALGETRADVAVRSVPDLDQPGTLGHAESVGIRAR
jgi:NAD(P)-dependent dehydrogenase (short-subunit alcohol dehydrogenase family)